MSYTLVTNFQSIFLVNLFLIATVYRIVELGILFQAHNNAVTPNLYNTVMPLLIQRIPFSVLIFLSSHSRNCSPFSFFFRFILFVQTRFYAYNTLQCITQPYKHIRGEFVLKVSDSETFKHITTPNLRQIKGKQKSINKLREKTKKPHIH